ncbi:hypothetical protein ED733_005707 [Metarhizium rileyi]|uniref:Uncharacterized protein n=1 Tax=Metarhizium rileyi (strain RCEF 4871) TaxID=1649241 RepID=A0A5C6GIT2_METRR|nr:hypothetical protein ED733_005707 [Metarhizium rileyi]
MALSKRRSKPADDTIQVPPLPPIPENAKQGIAPKRTGNFFDRKRTQFEAAGATTPLALAKKTDSSTLLKLSRGRRKASLKSQISDPTLNHVGSLPLAMKSEQKPDENKHLSDGSARSSVYNDSAVEDRAESRCGPKHDFCIMRPRLSPMEYARMYLIDEAQSRQENRKPQLPSPQKKWFWTPGQEKFLIIPKIPSKIRRDELANMPIDVTADDGQSLSREFEECPPTSVCSPSSRRYGILVDALPPPLDLSTIPRTTRSGFAASQLRHTEHVNAELCTQSHDQGDERLLSTSQLGVRSLTPLSKISGLVNAHFTDMSPSHDVNSLSAKSLLTMQASLIPGTVPRGKPHPLQVDESGPGRIHSISASIIGETTTEDFLMEVYSAPSPGILFGLQPSPHELVDRSHRSGSSNCRHYTSSPRRHSFDAEVNTSTQARTLSLGSSIQYARDSLIRPAMQAQYPENDPFTDQFQSSSSPASRGRLYSEDAIPDSPTLGHDDQYEVPGLPLESIDQLHEQQSFDLLKSYMMSRENRTGHSSDDTTWPTNSRRSTAKVLDSEQCKEMQYSSSFALNGNKSQHAFTLLSQLPSTQSTNVILHPSQVSQAITKMGTTTDNSTDLLQNFDTTSRLASVIKQRDFTISTPPSATQSEDSQKQPCAHKSSMLGGLFSRHKRSRSSESSISEARSPATKTSVSEKELWVFRNTRDHGGLQGESASISSQPSSIMGTEGREQQPRVVSGSSYSSTSSNSIAGLRDRFKLKMAPSKTKRRSRLQS